MQCNQVYTNIDYRGVLTIRVEHGDELEDKMSPEYLSTRIVWAQDEVKESIEHMTGGGFSRVDSASQIEYL